MSLNELVISGKIKRCDCNFKEFQLYKWEIETYRHTGNIFKDFINVINHTGKYSKIKRWIADCSVCGQLYFATTNKKDIIKYIKMMEKTFKEINISESIRKGKNQK